jgi:hypothetical protein
MELPCRNDPVGCSSAATEQYRAEQQGFLFVLLVRGRAIGGRVCWSMPCIGKLRTNVGGRLWLVLVEWFVFIDFVATGRTHTHTCHRARQKRCRWVEQSTQNVHRTNTPLRTTFVQVRGYRRQAGSIRCKALNVD